MRPSLFFFFFFNDTATTEIYTLSLHDALPISALYRRPGGGARRLPGDRGPATSLLRSEEHTSELQSLAYLVCRLLLEKKKKLPHRLLNIHYQRIHYTIVQCSHHPSPADCTTQC